MTPIFYLSGSNPATHHAANVLKTNGIPFSDIPSREVTHLLLDTPCKNYPLDLLSNLSLDVTIIGGNLEPFFGYRQFDLLQDPRYLAKNAAITAHCAIKLLLPRLPITMDGCPVLILGWGRIGKCLCELLFRLGARVSVYARKESDRGMAEALGYQSIHSDTSLTPYRAILNTIPCPILSAEQLKECSTGCIKMELASQPGLYGDDILPALGLPGKLAPESSGNLIAETFIRYWKEETV